MVCLVDFEYVIDGVVDLDDYKIHSLEGGVRRMP